MPWYYLQDDQTVGPVGLEELQVLNDQGAIHAHTHVIEEGASAWTTWGQLQGIDVAGPVTGGTACSQCGQFYTEDQMIQFKGSWVCGPCKPAFLQRLKEGSTLQTQSHFAGFWIRVLARLIDGLILTVPNMILSFPISIMMESFAQGDSDNVGIILGSTCGLYLLIFGIAIFYEAYFLKNYGATPGKMALGLKVIRSEGDGLTWGRAIGRYFGHMLSSFTLGIGFIIAAFDEEKRTLHDHICDTRVLRWQ